MVGGAVVQELDSPDSINVVKVGFVQVAARVEEQPEDYCAQWVKPVGTMEDR